MDSTPEEVVGAGAKEFGEGQVIYRRRAFQIRAAPKRAT